MITSLAKLQREIEKGDIINGKDVVTYTTLSLIHTSNNIYTISGGIRAGFAYKRIRKVVRDGEIIYECKHGGRRIRKKSN